MAREMKDSGIEWIGEIPKEWEIIRIKYVAEFEPKCNMSELSNDSIVTYLPMECLKNGYFERRQHNLGDLPVSLTRFQENDIVMAKVTPCFENGNIAIMQKLQSGFGLGSSELFVLRCKKVNIYYLFWWLQNKGFVSQACSTMTGTGGLKRISPYFIKNCAMHMPPEMEQVRISNFLYVQCVELDNVIEKTRASIEEYKKLKQAVITQVVTKGIRSDREMKDSGIEWIEKIPAEWEERRIKTLFALRDEKNFSPLEEVNLISLYTDLGVVQHSELEKTTGNKASNADGYKMVYKDDIVVNIILCWMGAIGCSEYNGVTSPAYDIYIPQSGVLSKFYHYYFRTKGFNGDCYKRGRGIMAMRWRTYSDQFRDIKVVHPSLEEQQEIVNYLDQKCAAIDDLITKKEQYLSEIENYKKSLIYEYVTGKKEVPREYNV